MRFSFLILVISIIIAPFVSKAQVKVALSNTNNAHIVSDDKLNWGLEVNGKLVADKKYSSFSTKDGTLFIAELHNGKMGVCNSEGSFIFPCEYETASLSGDYIVLRKDAESKPKFYNKNNPSVEVFPKQMTMAQLNDEIAAKAPSGTYFDPVRLSQQKAIEQARELSAKTGFLGTYEIRDKSTGATGNARGEAYQELVVDGKVVFTAITFENITSIKQWEELGRNWFFIVTNRVKNREVYGIFQLAKWIEDGKLKVYHGLSLPMEYSFIKVRKNTYWLDCSRPNGGSALLNWWGKTVDEVKEMSSKVYEINMECNTQDGLVLKKVLIGKDFTELRMEYTEKEEGGDFSINGPGWEKEYMIKFGDKTFKLQ